MLYYLPLEPLKERYTWQWSAPITGWLERNWLRAKIPYKRINGTRGVRDYIGKGVVLDAVSRSTYCFSQMCQLLELADRGELKTGDVIYLDDFWTPGLEALPYLLDQIGVKVEVYSFLFAQSVDEYDFTHKMRGWMRPIEHGYANIMSGIFVAHPLLKKLVVDGGIAPESKVFVSGHPFCSEEVKERMPFVEGPWEVPREEKVVYSSRWDDEKNPLFFLRVARELKKDLPHVRFVVCSGFRAVKSNNPANMDALKHAVAEGIVEVRENLSKEEYYYELCTAKVQMNTAFQDFVPLTLLEASVAGCYPVYPAFRSFPETLKDEQYMYTPWDEQDACALLIDVLESYSFWTEKAIRSRAWIHERFDTSWQRQLIVMGLMEGTFDEPR